MEATAKRIELVDIETAPRIKRGAVVVYESIPLDCVMIAKKNQCFLMSSQSNQMRVNMLAMFNEKTVKVIREQSREMEKKGSLTPEVLNIIYKYGLFKLFLPQELNGNMTPLPEALRIFDTVAWIDGSIGWLVNIGSGGGVFSSAISPHISRDIYTSNKAVIAGNGSPAGIAKREKGGYRVRGEWKYCSGSTHATVFTANCRIEGGNFPSEAEIRSFIFLPEQVRIVKDWDAFGLKATASHTILVESVWVPEEMTFDMLRNPFHYEYPVFHYPFVPFAQASFTAVIIGIGRHFIEEAKRISQGGKEGWGSERFHYVMKKIDEGEQRLEGTIRDFYQTVDASWDTHLKQKGLTEKQYQGISHQCKETARIVWDCVGSVFPFLGIQAVMEDVPINKMWRDLQTACQHTLLVPFYDW